MLEDDLIIEYKKFSKTMIIVVIIFLLIGLSISIFNDIKVFIQ